MKANISILFIILSVAAFSQQLKVTRDCGIWGGRNIEKKEDITAQKINYFKEAGAEYVLIAGENPPFSAIHSTSEEMILRGKGIYIFRLIRN